MKRIFALTIILGIIICAVCATSFSAERFIGHSIAKDNSSGDDISLSRVVGDLPTEESTEPTEETQVAETRVIETIVVETPTTEETVGEDVTTPEETEVPTEAETVVETTVEPTTPESTDTPATDDSVPPVEPKKNHPHAVKTGDNGLLFVGIGLLAVALIALFVTMRKRTHTYEK